MVARLGDETVHFEPLDDGVVVVGVSLVNSQPQTELLIDHELLIAYLALLTFSIGQNWTDNTFVLSGTTITPVEAVCHL